MPQPVTASSGGLAGPRPDMSLDFLKLSAGHSRFGTKAITRCCRATFRGSTPAILNSRPSSETNRNILTFGIIKEVVAA